MGFRQDWMRQWLLLGRSLLPLLAAALVLLGAGGSMGAGAEPIPPEWLREQHASCMFTCTQSPANAPADCERACSCADQETAHQFTRQEYIAMRRALQTKQKLPPALAEKVRTVGDRCTPGPDGL